MRKLCLSGALVAGALLIAGCGGTEEKAAEANDSANAAAPAEEAAAAEEGTNEAMPAEEGGDAAAAAGSQQDFTIVNNTGRTLMTLNVSPNDENEWGPDILGADTLANGGSGQVTFARGNDQCLWDLRATFDDGQSGDWRGVNLCETTTVTLTPA
ncbi:MAG TPA: hypothetical protein VN231_04620 [Allosphingosinicella sp.]|nr:hypothetical protein [Allosphingosinicella sp.]